MSDARRVGWVLGWVSAALLGCVTGSAPPEPVPEVAPVAAIDADPPTLERVARALADAGAAGRDARVALLTWVRLQGWVWVLAEVSGTSRAPCRSLIAFAPTGETSCALAPGRGALAIGSLGAFAGAPLVFVERYEGGSGSYTRELVLYGVSERGVTTLGAITLEDVCKSTGFGELCQAAKPEDARRVDVRRVGDLLLVSGALARCRRASLPGTPLEIARVETPVDEVYGLSSSGLERLR